MVVGTWQWWLLLGSRCWYLVLGSGGCYLVVVAGTRWWWLVLAGSGGWYLVVVAGTRLWLLVLAGGGWYSLVLAGGGWYLVVVHPIHAHAAFSHGHGLKHDVVLPDTPLPQFRCPPVSGLVEANGSSGGYGGHPSR